MTFLLLLSLLGLSIFLLNYDPDYSEEDEDDAY